MFCYNFIGIFRSDKENYKKVLTKRRIYDRIVTDICVSQKNNSER